MTVIRLPRRRQSPHDGDSLAQRREEESRLALMAAAAEDPAAPAPVRWSGVIGVEGSPTGDGRLIQKNALRWENLPILLRYVPEDRGKHEGAMVAGRITEIERTEDGLLRARGDFDMGGAVGQEAARQVREGLTTGVSMDLDNVSFEFRVARDLVEGDGEMPMDPEAALAEDEDGRVTIMEQGADDAVEVTTDGRIRAATLVAIPAFEQARIAIEGEEPAAPPAEEEEAECPPGQHRMPDGSCMDDEDMPVTAAAIPVDPPAAWFTDPQLDGPTALQVTSDGRVSGHLAVWDTCHTGMGGCTPPPRSETGYAYFHTGSILTREGTEIPVGRLTMDTRHAVRSASASATMRHYDHTGTAIADVRAGEDAYGIWVSGAVRPSASPEQMRVLRSSPLSGDWRRIGTNLELVAALAVNVPGFPVPRPAGLVAGAAMQALVAAGMLAPRKVIRPGLPGALSTQDLRYLKRMAAREREYQQSEAAKMARRVRASQLASRVNATRSEVS